jgi:hypothetical protein
MDRISRRTFAEQLALSVAAPWFIDDLPQPPGPKPQASQEPSALAKALAETIRLRYPDRFTPDDLTALTRSIDNRLRQVDRLSQIPLANGDEPDFVYSVYRGAD